MFFFAISQKGNSTRSCAHITQSTKSNEKSVVKWFNRFDILSQCPFKCRSFVCLTTSQQMKRAFYMIGTKPTTSNQQHQMYWWSTTVLRFVCLYVFIANALLLMITFGSGSVWHFCLCSLSIKHHEFRVHVFDWIVKLYKSFAYEIDLSVWCWLNVFLFFQTLSLSPSLSLSIRFIGCYLSLYFTLATASCRHSIF